jgi:outer membrane protein assembly factor BamE (lipoprotein component of BamABCDE complex)
MTKSILLVLALVVSAALLQTGCASSVGRQIDLSQVTRIEKGKTTKAELLQMFGSPMSVALMGDGKEALIWHYTTSKVKGSTFIPVVGMMSGGADTQMTMLQVILNKEKVVDDFTHNVGNIESRMGR